LYLFFNYLQEQDPTVIKSSNGSHPNKGPNGILDQTNNTRQRSRRLAARKALAMKKKNLAASNKGSGVAAIAAMLRRKNINTNNNNNPEEDDSVVTKKRNRNDSNSLKCVIRRVNGTSYNLKGTPTSPLKSNKLGKLTRNRNQTRQMPKLTPIVANDPNSPESRLRSSLAKVIVRKKDGTEKIYQAPEGKRLMIRKPDGSIIVIHPDGKQVMKRPNGVFVVVKEAPGTKKSSSNSGSSNSDEPPKLEDQTKYYNRNIPGPVQISSKEKDRVRRMLHYVQINNSSHMKDNGIQQRPKSPEPRTYFPKTNDVEYYPGPTWGNNVAPCNATIQ